MKKAAFIKHVHKALRDSGIQRGHKNATGGLWYESHLEVHGISIEVACARHSSIPSRNAKQEEVFKALAKAGIYTLPPRDIWLFIRFDENGVE